MFRRMCQKKHHVIIVALLLPLFAFGKEAVWTRRVSLTSNNIWRGTTFSNNKPAIQADILYSSAQGYNLGTFFSTAEFDDPTLGSRTVTQEIDFYGGKSFTVGDFDFEFTYSWFTFGRAWSYNSEEFNFKTYWKNWILELSYMDGYFGGNSIYRAARLGYEHPINATDTLQFFSSYNQFSRPKGNIEDTNNPSDPAAPIQSLNGAGNTDYVELYINWERMMTDDAGISLAYNWTNRFVYDAADSIVTKQNARDETFIVTVFHTF